MQVDAEWLQSGLRFSLGPWLLEKNMEVIPDLLNQAIDAAASSA
jgi:cysteine desulfurase